MSSSIKRSIDEDRFEKMTQDTAFLAERVRREHGELDLRLRDNYFNLYYKGNSMAKVRVPPCGGKYEVSIHRKFSDEADANKGKTKKPLTGYSVDTVDPAELRKCLSKQKLDGVAARIKRVNWGEEVTFEQMLITDNPPRPEFLIIDRQVTGGALERQRLDLLALRRADPSGDLYRFVVLEVKLGNNPELSGKVLTQLRGYINALTSELDSFARCYEGTYQQMHKMGLLGDGMPSEIQIGGLVEGMIVVGGYSGEARASISTLKELKASTPDSTDDMVSVWWRPCSLDEGAQPL